MKDGVNCRGSTSISFRRFTKDSRNWPSRMQPNKKWEKNKSIYNFYQAIERYRVWLPLSKSECRWLIDHWAIKWSAFFTLFGVEKLTPFYGVIPTGTLCSLHHSILTPWNLESMMSCCSHVTPVTCAWLFTILSITWSRSRRPFCRSYQWERISTCSCAGWRMQLILALAPSQITFDLRHKVIYARHHAYSKPNKC
jgi:hypothetical protein